MAYERLVVQPMRLVGQPEASWTPVANRICGDLSVLCGLGPAWGMHAWAVSDCQSNASCLAGK